MSMKTQESIEAKFIPCGKGTPLPELFALRSRAKEELIELNSQKKSLRSALASRVFSLRQRAYQNGVRNGTRKKDKS